MKTEKTIWQIYGARGGRPPKFKNAKEMQKMINEYFDFLIEHKEKPTITGLTLYLGFSDRASFYDHEKNPGFSYTIKRARLMIETHYEQLLQYGNAGAIFALKNMGWKDKSEVEQTITEKKEVFKIGDQIIEF